MDSTPISRAADDSRVTFSGRAGEFFGIWIVNILLSLVTLGIYSAWAKVRTRQYFYSSTRVGGAAFDYLARPGQILKGRLIAVAVLVAYSVVSDVVPYVEPWLTLSLMTLLPWVIVKAITFNARNTAHRGLRFDFHGNYWRALLGYLVLPLAGLVSAGLALPVGAWYRAHFLVGHSAYGATRFTLQQPLRAFYGAYARALLLALVVLGPAVAGLAVWYGPGLVDDLQLLPRLLQEMETDDAPAAETTDIENVTAAAAPVDGDDEAPLSEEQEKRAQKLFLAMITLFYPLLGLAAVAWIYLGVLLANLTWNGARLGPLAFELRLRFGYMLWLKTSNLAAIVFSFGLAVPWTRIRNARYLTSRLHVFGLEHADDLVGGARRRGSVVGEELGEAFDVDLGF